MKKVKGQKIDKKATIMAALLIMAVLISGTFAFTQVRQGALNPARVGQLEFVGGRMHDDFEDTSSYGNIDKDVYAENFGISDLGVRVQFREFLELNGEVVGGTSVGPASINNTQTWPLVMFDNPTTRRPGTYSAQIGAAGISWNLGNDDEVHKVFMPTHNQVGSAAPFNPSPAVNVPAPFMNNNVHRFSNTTGRAVEALANFNLNAVTSIYDFFGSGMTTGSSESDGTHDFWEVGDTYTTNLIYIDLDATPPHITYEAGVTHTAQHTMIPEAGGIMTMGDWIEAGHPRGNFWIMDTDSWFYWNGYLLGSQTREALLAELDLDPLEPIPAEHAWLTLPTVATSLLLNGVNVPNHNDLSYIIYINADFFETNDIATNPMLDLSDEAELIFLRESLWLDASVFEFDTASTAGISADDEAVIIATFEPVINRYRGHRFVDYVSANFEAEILGGGDSQVEVSMILNEVSLQIAPNESRSSLTIKISDPRTENYFVLEVPVIDVGSSGTTQMAEFTAPTPGLLDSDVNLPNEAGSRWTDETGVSWYVLVSASDEFGGVGNALIITEHVHGMNDQNAESLQWNEDNSFNTFDNSIIRDAMNAWFNDYEYVSGDLRSSALNFSYADETGTLMGMRNVLGAGIEIPTTIGAGGPWLTSDGASPNIVAALSLPAVPESGGEVFALSYSEVQRFIMETDGTGLVRQANLFGTNEPATWWLRSPGTSATLPIRRVNANGTVRGATATSESGFRPALWVVQ